ncbi:alanine racemase [Edaphobacter acidisoli]|uniref:alanine racemase n=1 Tax=Edaphobacter acidisoli TaxID=2040573 RepID=UPI00166CE0F8|nr:alanine racemase [Edaphobacter acidisoli]
MKSWVEISAARLVGNLQVLVEAAGADVAVLPVVKADAYGHGAELCAPVLARAGVEWLGVADALEGLAVRRALSAAGIAVAEQPRVLVMCGPLGEDDAVLEHGLTPVIWTREQVERLGAAARRRGAGLVRVHLEVDSGMTRQGAAVEGVAALLCLMKENGLVVDGVMTHFASAEFAGSEQTRAQRERFAAAVRVVAEAGVRPEWVHAGNSSTIDNDAAEDSLCWLWELAASVGARAMARPGIALYGYCLPIEGEGRALVRERLRPVMTWKTRVMDVREVRAGDAVGYNATFVANEPMRLALLPIGYSDGLRRELSSTNGRAGGWVMVRGQRAAIVGRVSMNLTVVDVSGIDGVSVDDEVAVLGDGVTADDHARVAGTISYEILCGVRAERRVLV